VDYADFIRKLQLPTGFTVPTELAYEDLVARTITRDHLRDDVRGINASIELIQRTRGGRWPTGPVTEAGNFADLVWHEVEFRDGGSFTYRGLAAVARGAVPVRGAVLLQRGDSARVAMCSSTKYRGSSTGGRAA
jgi:hypothetical protein